MAFISTGGDTLLQDESHMAFQFLCGAACFHICNLLSAKNCVIADPEKKNHRSLNNYAHQGLKLTPANSLSLGKI